MGMVVIGAVFMDIKGFPDGSFVPTGRNAGRVEHIHGGVGRNVVEDIANCELRPTFISLVDDTAAGAEIIHKLQNHKVDTKHVRKVKDGMGTWMAIFDTDGDVFASISKRPDLSRIADILDQEGDEIFSNADSVVIEIDLDKDIVKRVFKLAKKHNKKVFAIVSNMSIALERRDFLQSIDCFICNLLEAGLLFAADYSETPASEMELILAEKVARAQIPSMIVTMGADGAVYATKEGEHGFCPSRKVTVYDTTGAGDSFASGVAIGLTYGKTMAESCEIGATLAASVIVTSESVCPRFLPSELGLDIPVAD